MRGARGDACEMSMWPAYLALLRRLASISWDRESNSWYFIEVDHRPAANLVWGLKKHRERCAAGESIEFPVC